MKSKLELALGLKHTEIEQIKHYIRWAEDEGAYYGNKEQFINRHTNIKRAFEMND